MSSLAIGAVELILPLLADFPFGVVANLRLSSLLEEGPATSLLHFSSNSARRAFSCFSNILVAFGSSGSGQKPCSAMVFSLFCSAESSTIGVVMMALILDSGTNFHLGYVTWTCVTWVTSELSHSVMCSDHRCQKVPSARGSLALMLGHRLLDSRFIHRGCRYVDILDPKWVLSLRWRGRYRQFLG